MSDDAASEVRARALAALARREHTKAELTRKLVARGHDATAVSAVVDDLAAARLQSDGRHAESYMRSRASRGYGPQRIQAELKQRGASAETIARALQGSDADWIDCARRADAKKFGVTVGADPTVRARRRRFLEYRGFTTAQIRAVLDGDQELD